MAPEVGLEPTTNRLTADRSTTELLRKAGSESKSQLPRRINPFGSKLAGLLHGCSSRAGSFIDALRFGKFFTRGVRVLFQSPGNEDAAIFYLRQMRRNFMEGFKSALVENFSGHISSRVEIGGQCDRLENMKVTFGIKEDIGIDEGDHFSEGEVGIDDIFIGFFHTQVELGAVGFGREAQKRVGSLRAVDGALLTPDFATVEHGEWHGLRDDFTLSGQVDDGGGLIVALFTKGEERREIDPQSFILAGF